MLAQEKRLARSMGSGLGRVILLVALLLVLAVGMGMAVAHREKYVDALNQIGKNLMCSEGASLCGNDIILQRSDDGARVHANTDALDVTTAGDEKQGITLFSLNKDGANMRGSEYQGGLASWWGIGFMNKVDKRTRFVHDTRTGETKFLGGSDNMSRFRIHPGSDGRGPTTLQADVFDKGGSPLLLNPDGGTVGIGLLPKVELGDYALRVQGNTRTDVGGVGYTEVVGSRWDAARFRVMPGGVGAAPHISLQSDNVLDGFKGVRPLMLNPEGGGVGVGPVSKIPMNGTHYYDIKDALYVEGDARVSGKICINKTCVDETKLAKLAAM